MELPASEIEFWRDYYQIFPFPQERADARTALLAQTISNMSGRMLKDMYLTRVQDFLPDYLEERDLSKKSREAQIKAEEEFVKKALASGIGVKEQQ